MLKHISGSKISKEKKLRVLEVERKDTVLSLRIRGKDEKKGKSAGMGACLSCAGKEGLGDIGGLEGMGIVCIKHYWTVFNSATGRCKLFL